MANPDKNEREEKTDVNTQTVFMNSVNWLIIAIFTQKCRIIEPGWLDGHKQSVPGTYKGLKSHGHYHGNCFKLPRVK